MALTEKLKSMLGGSQEEQLFGHQCGDCGMEFEAPDHNPNNVACPECGSERIHTVT